MSISGLMVRAHVRHAIHIPSLTAVSLHCPLRLLALQIIVVMAMLINVMKLWPALAGFLVTVALIPLNTLLGKAVTAVRKKVIAATDARVRMATEVIMGIKAIKLYAWEEPYLNRIAKLREEELKAIRTSNLLGSFYMMVMPPAPRLGRGRPARMC